MAATMKPPDTKAWWFNRRILAYLSMLGLFTLPVYAWFAATEHLTAMMPLLIALAWVFAGFIYLYAGAATAEDITKLRGMMK